MVMPWKVVFCAPPLGCRGVLHWRWRATRPLAGLSTSTPPQRNMSCDASDATRAPPFPFEKHGWVAQEGSVAGRHASRVFGVGRGQAVPTGHLQWQHAVNRGGVGAGRLSFKSRCQLPTTVQCCIAGARRGPASRGPKTTDERREPCARGIDVRQNFPLGVSRGPFLPIAMDSISTCPGRHAFRQESFHWCARSQLINGINNPCFFNDASCAQSCSIWSKSIVESMHKINL